MFKLLHKFNCLMGRHMFLVTKQSRLCAIQKLSCVHCNKSFMRHNNDLTPWDSDCEAMSKAFKWKEFSNV